MPSHSLLLLVVWLVLNNTVSLGHIVLGSFFGFMIPLVCSPLRIPQPKMAKPLKLFPYILIVIKDVIIANIEVAVLVMGSMKKIQPGFIAIPLELKESLPITMLASTVTMTPGTVSAELSQDRAYLYVHVLSMPKDESEIIDYIKDTYEARLKEIFGC